MSAAANLVHKGRNRLRLRFQSKRKDAGWFTELSEKLRSFSGVHEVEANPFTGSVLILHQGNGDALLRQAEKAKLFRLVEERAQAQPWPETLFRKIDASSEKISQSTNGQWDLPTIAATGMIGLGLYQALRRELLPPAWTLIGDALVVLSKNRKSASEASDALAVHNI